jgi:hypothetical protein
MQAKAGNRGLLAVALRAKASIRGLFWFAASPLQPFNALTGRSQLSA